jgi:hypothetical protein
LPIEKRAAPTQVRRRTAARVALARPPIDRIAGDSLATLAAAMPLPRAEAEMDKSARLREQFGSKINTSVS